MFRDMGKRGPKASKNQGKTVSFHATPQTLERLERLRAARRASGAQKASNGAIIESALLRLEAEEIAPLPETPEAAPPNH